MIKNGARVNYFRHINMSILNPNPNGDGWLSSDTSNDSGDYVDDGYISSSSDAGGAGDLELCHLSAAAVLTHKRISRPVIPYRDEEYLEIMLDDVNVDNALVTLSDTDDIESDFESVFG